MRTSEITPEGFAVLTVCLSGAVHRVKKRVVTAEWTVGCLICTSKEDLRPRGEARGAARGGRASHERVKRWVHFTWMKVIVLCRNYHNMIITCNPHLTVNLRWFKHLAAEQLWSRSQYEQTEGGNEILMRWLYYTVCCPVLSCSPVTSKHDTEALVYQPLTLRVVSHPGCELWSEICWKKHLCETCFKSEVQVPACMDVTQSVLPPGFV